MSGGEPAPLRPRTVRPGRGDEPVLRPATVPALGRPKPIPHHELPAHLRGPAPHAPTASGDLGWDPATGAVPILIDPDEDLEPVTVFEAEDALVDLAAEDWSEHASAGDLATHTDELGTVDRELVTDPQLDRDEWADILTFTDEIEAVAPAGAATDPAVGPAADEPDAVAEATEPRRLLRNNLFVASGTALSRATGLVRSLLILGVLVEGLGDAYNNANNTPNQIYELILGGVLTATLVPLFTDDLERRGRNKATSAIISTAVIALAVVTLVAFVAGPGIIYLLSLGSPEANAADYLAVGVKLSLIFAPQVFFYGLMAVWSAVLNARHRFLAAAWAPVLNNLIAIATLLAAWRYVGHKPTLADAVADLDVVLILGVGTTLGIVVMALSLYPSVRRSGVRIDFRPQFRHPAVQQAVRLSGWTFGYVIANLVAVNVIQYLAKPGSGDPTAYTTAFQFFQLPHGLLAVSIMVTFEPLLGRTDVRGDRAGFNRHLLLGYRLIGLLVIPAAIGYIALPAGLDYRTFEAAGFAAKFLDVSTVIAAFAVGLPGFSLYLYSMRAFYAMKNTKLPFLINLVENVINVVAAIAFARWWGVVGLALAYGLAYSVASVLAVAVLIRRSPGFDWRGLLGTIIRLLVAAGIMGGVVFGTVALLPLDTLLHLGIAAVVGVVVGVVVYVVAIVAIRVEGIDELFRRLPGFRRFART